MCDIVLAFSHGCSCPHFLDYQGFEIQDYNPNNSKLFHLGFGMEQLRPTR